MEYTGRLTVKGTTQQISEKFSKRTFVLTDGAASYPQLIEFQLNKDNCSLLDSANIGDEIKVIFNLKGREWTNPQGQVKYFNALEAFRLTIISKRAEVNGEDISATSYDDSLPF